MLGQVAQFDNALGDQQADPNAVYILWSAANDYLLELVDSPTVSVSNIATAVEQLYGLGARSFVLLNLPDLGDVPIVAGQGALVSQQLTIDLIDVYSLWQRLTANLTDFGFTGLAAGPAAGCLLEPFDCSPVERFSANSLFWDEQHPTENFYRILAAVVLNRLAAVTDSGDETEQVFRNGFELITVE